ncbi:DNA primase [Aciditerrimonas ferrireducens]|uniref:DNA primase n=1 Tax=Aciditerrimonas ferrireducens TaxID=667306 RepID=UPI0020042DD1|nr:DNA primase [Aciditerrimonas ferrireducens]MCK4176485.1 DNA primase [Aciditerrimonas ferrireducens]
MAIPEEVIAEVRARTDLVALVGAHTALRRQGRRFVGRCPFHEERTPSFSVNAEAGLYYCFGCHASGDAISFVRATEGCDFVEAVRRLAAKAGVALPDDRDEQGSRGPARAALLDALTRAVAFYHQRLLEGPDAGPARAYLRSRGYDGAVVRRYQLGWAPDEFDALARALRVPDEVFVGAGLGFVNRRGRQQDGLRGRVVFPILDPSGQPIALGGRVLPGAPGPKYKNSPEGPLYKKRRTLYGLSWAKQAVVARGRVVVCEGYTDVIGCQLAGVEEAVATCGTALAEEHLRLLANFAKRIVLCFDADRAGQAGAARVYQWERTHQVDVAVAELPEGADPAELARADPEALRRAVDEARPLLRVQVDRVLGAFDLREPEGRAKAAEAALVVVAEHPDPLVQDQYLVAVADRCRLDPEQLRPLLARLPRGARTEGPRPGEALVPGGRDGRPGDGRPGTFGSQQEAPPGPRGPERSRRAPAGEARAGLEALRLAVHRPEAVGDRLDPCLFADPTQRQVLGALLAAEDLHEAIGLAEETDPAAAALLRRLAVEEPVAEVDDVVAQLVRVAVQRALRALEAEARRSPERAAELAQEANQVRSTLERLDEQPADREAVEGLVAWLAGRGEEDG